jgi:hypothetical protein
MKAAIGRRARSTFVDSDKFDDIADGSRRRRPFTDTRPDFARKDARRASSAARNLLLRRQRSAQIVFSSKATTIDAPSDLKHFHVSGHPIVQSFEPGEDVLLHRRGPG